MPRRHVAAAALLIACGGSKGADPSAATGTTTAATSASASSARTADAQPAAAVALGAAFAVAEFGLVGNSPAGDTCTPNVVGAKLARLECGSWAITLEIASAINDATVDGAKETVTRAWSDVKNFKSQTLPDGWQLTFDASDAGAPRYHLKTYRTIAAKAYECDTTAKSVVDREKAIAVCGSLKAKPH